MTVQPRQPSLLDATCDAFVHDLAALTPTDATAWGIEGHDHELEDFSPAYWDALADRSRDMLADVDAFDDCTDCNDDEDDFDDVDRTTARVLRDRLCLQLDLHHTSEYYGLLNNLASPVQTIRDTFAQMEPGTDTLRARMSKVPHALAGYRESLALATAQGRVAALRQVELLITECNQLAGAHSMLDTLGIAGTEVTAAKRAFSETANWLSEHLAPNAPLVDAVGRERYERFSHQWVGTRVDLDEAYEWGLDQLGEIRAEQQKLAAELYGTGVTVGDAMGRLNADPRYTIHGTDELQKWMQEQADRAVKELGESEFNIPEQIRTIECRIDPSGTGGVFYTAPTDDFSRPGRMWWSVPAGEDTFHTWQELTTVYHEGVPGHHLQIGAALLAPLNLWRRAACWNSGHGEGWALYAESLMRDLGYLDDPGFRMGFLDAQRLRAARVVLDIGVHLGKTVPDGISTWDASFARNFLRENSAMSDTSLDFELNRYLGWPGQAPSYALGQRLWQDLRNEAVSAGQSVQDFHARALALGSIPMHILREEVLRG
ncbi:DUF885 domain-containing protein [Corynebacterium epidermidicanis]|uniref:DUF885 domain-containing protein n=1 Tax=Corynebacterium epidermidicanis TaxID=1050174 RepID=A0A0G3GLE1_9CORY|nr:DUF885 domain-containing protein [Corynebacterium epidermidicanis]AKK02051.1 hypothetical protein CEPID_00785 [Corynebacterium epidermidicanis]